MPSQLDLQIELKNYRAFEDGQPTSITIGPGLTALVGPNNSGKSSVLKLFHELAHLWSQLADKNGFRSLATGTQSGFNPRDVFDASEIFSVSNTRDISITISTVARMSAATGIQVPTGIRITIPRRAPQSFGIDLLGLSRQLSGKKGLHGESLVTIDGSVVADISPWDDVLTRFARPLYVGPFRNAINQGGGQHFGLDVGTAFIEKWHEWKAGPDKAKNRKVIDVEREIERIFKFNTLDIGAAKEWNTLQVTVNRVPFKLQELGAGLAQFILLLGDAATSEPTLILIDEPELHLHPSLQSELLLTLGGFASEGLAFATHSLGLARSLGDRIFSFQRQGAGVKVAPFVSTPRYAEFLGEMSFVAYEEIGTDKIFLVEGASDVRVFQVLLRKFGKADDYVVVPLGGDQLARGDMEQELAELLRLTPKIRCVVDSERSEPGGSAKPERVAFAQTCQKLGIDLLVTERRAIENYFPETAIRAVKGSGYRALTLYERLANSERPWSKGENWRIALQMSAGDLTETDLGDFLADS